jgi:hypothetical protein
MTRWLLDSEVLFSLVWPRQEAGWEGFGPEVKIWRCRGQESGPSPAYTPLKYLTTTTPSR